MTALTWRVVGVSQQGKSHQEKNIPCQDFHDYRILPDGTLIIAVADGAGSAERAVEGARCVVKQAIALLESRLSEQLAGDEAGWCTVMTQAFREAHQALVQFASIENAPLRSFSTTLICTAASDDWLVVGQIGDGAAVTQAVGGSPFITVKPQRGEYANETYFLTVPDALNYLEVRVYHQPTQALAVMTDGLLRLALKLPEYEPYPKFFEPLLSFASELENEEQVREQLAAFLASERVCARTDDDKTLVLATCLRHSPTAMFSSAV